MHENSFVNYSLGNKEQHKRALHHMCVCVILYKQTPSQHLNCCVAYWHAPHFLRMLPSEMQQESLLDSTAWDCSRTSSTGGRTSISVLHADAMSVT
eukprot:623896-Amphidinium_carterae.2